MLPVTVQLVSVVVRPVGTETLNPISPELNTPPPLKAVLPVTVELVSVRVPP